MDIIESNLEFRETLNKHNNPSMIVIYHSAHNSATVEDIHRCHLDNGLSGFGYHFFITKDGQIYRGRPEDAIGDHAKGYDNISFGICVQGNYDVEEMEMIQFKALMELCDYLCDKYSISNIKGHRDLIVD